MAIPEFTASPLSQIQSTRLDYLWDPYLPRGKVVVLDGDPGVGKSFLTLDLAARLSRGGDLPDGKSAGRPQVTLLLSGEDGAADTIRPRAEAAGADLERLLVLASTDGAVPVFPGSTVELGKLILKHRADLVVIDPLASFLPDHSSVNTDQCVRGLLRAWAVLAVRTNCTVLLVRHLRKKGAANALFRGLGSISIVGAVRVGLLAAVHPSDPTARVLAVTKSNLSTLPPSLGYRIIGPDSRRGRVEWTGPVNVTADQLGVRPAPKLPRDHAAEWLRAFLAAGPVTAGEVYTAASSARIPDRTLQRAKRDARIKSLEVDSGDGKGVWFWYDPAAPWPKDAPFKRPDEFPPPEFAID